MVLLGQTHLVVAIGAEAQIPPIKADKVQAVQAEAQQLILPIQPQQAVAEQEVQALTVVLNLALVHNHRLWEALVCMDLALAVMVNLQVQVLMVLTQLAIVEVVVKAVVVMVLGPSAAMAVQVTV